MIISAVIMLVLIAVVLIVFNILREKKKLLDEVIFDLKRNGYGVPEIPKAKRKYTKKNITEKNKTKKVFKRDITNPLQDNV
jgi:lipopolysaccharide/colanic/teichoic acid biosynthesis glycosyltransferase